MKLRIKGDSIRMRLSKSEVEELVNEGQVWDSCNILKKQLIYGIKSSSQEEMSSYFLNSKLTIEIPEISIVNWNKDERVSFQIVNPDGLNILVEKDFKCLIERPNEKEDDMYDNPARKK